ncbi:hypothetical protein H8356DRAFT_1014015 [Neocallimastix lanati (nom. inval.)]|jgi:hypothetical protein|uniref:Proteasome assembly chaperone 1 n=1 Tax=Neocallimastix californiae TaxID=1754190 RepID=A0A1Y2C0F5_9FUNG|nr:hypothetical protein H8356DRAFT_1014015 [Neocallimastix sp. JGI-2020a]ORY39795.1 hypothetical protein LY90DRAFT_672353 [Neocallimastix californiae]|eukprot:ORY39795.1 hypothetical protein LY90DRAFT_672353 [Neocallimastix californiae]
MIKISEKLNKYVILAYCDVSLFGPKVALTVNTNNSAVKVECPLLDKVKEYQDKKIEKYKNNELLEETGSNLEPISSEFQDFSDFIVIQNEKDYSLITITARLPEYTNALLSKSLIELFVQNSVESVIIISSQDMNIPSDKKIYGYSTSGKLMVPNVEILDNNLPMNSSFLNTLAILLNIKNIPTIYLTCLGKKINKDTQLEEQNIKLMKNTLNSITGLTFKDISPKLNDSLSQKTEELLYI